MIFTPRAFPFRFARILVAFSVLAFSADRGLAEPSYRIGPGDELSVNFPLQGNLGDLSKLSGNSLAIQIVGDAVFWHHQVLVAPDGYIDVPSFPPLKASGLTLVELEKLFTAQLKSPYEGNSVSVILTKPNSTAFYVWGEVKQPGRFVLERPTTLMEALSTAGGPTALAHLKKVLLIRKGEATRHFDLSLKQLRTNGAPDIPIQPSDTIVVPKRWTVDQFYIFVLLGAISTASAAYVAAKQ